MSTEARWYEPTSGNYFDRGYFLCKCRDTIQLPGPFPSPRSIRSGTDLYFQLQYATYYDTWVWTYFTERQWEHATPVSKLEFLVITGHDLEETLKEFWGYTLARETKKWSRSEIKGALDLDNDTKVL